MNIDGGHRMRRPARDTDQSLFRLVYDSVVLLPFGAEGERGLKDILDVAQIHNTACGITAVLHCDGAYFMQILEGPADAVERLVERIMRDPRHTNIRVVSRGSIMQRDFPDWNMALVNEEEMARAIVRHPLLPEIHPYRAAELVLAMRTVLADRPN